MVLGYHRDYVNPKDLRKPTESPTPMGFRDLELKPSYDSEEDDLVTEFYIRVLSKAKMYYRLAGFFSSCALALAARGISNLIANGGKVKVVAGAKFQEADVKAIQEGSEAPDRIIAQKFLADLDTIENKIIENHVKALAWMVANKSIELKVAVLSDDRGLPMDEARVNRRGYFHMKVGILEDEEGDQISFSGSLNESCKGWLENEEEFHVFRKWVEAERAHLESNLRKFKRYWDGTSKNVVTLDLPEAVRRKILQIAPDNIDDFDFDGDYKNRLFAAPLRKLRPWRHQLDAVKAWKENNYRGIIEMATGTGKTLVALLCANRYFKDTRPFGHRTIVIVPGRELVGQWKDDIESFFSSGDFVVRYDSSTSRREKMLARRMWRWDIEGDKRNTFLVITIDSVRNFRPLPDYPPDLVIADEVHAYGTEKKMDTLRRHVGEAKAGLGMSATPERYYDHEGTKMIKEYFGPVILRYKIRRAQQDGILARYKYFVYPVELEIDEEEDVDRLTRRIGQNLARDFSREISEGKRDLPLSAVNAMIQRARVIKKARNKLSAFERILKDHSDELRQCIVYCEDTSQLNAAQEVFDNLGIDSYVRFHSKTVNRKQALNLFKLRNCRFVLSMHCLDQGINIPMCDSLILLSSSANPREYIQRRGRVLRNPPGGTKSVVKIFDVLVFPRVAKEAYKGLVMTQLLRAWEFIRCSDSPEAQMEIQQVLSSYAVSTQELEKITGKW